MVRLKGLEPLAHSLEGCCSIHLSYRRISNAEFGMGNSEFRFVFHFAIYIPQSAIETGRGERI